ncbi:MAG: CinA family protein [Oscillospiraceae bacterium]|nr:CinA family protein [Oscillospiraceae bacterium]
MDEAYRAISLLTEKQKTLVTAESCTGGLLGAMLTEVPGASKVYLGGIISYAYELKEQCLGVDRELLEERGAVCPDVAEQMAIGARQRLNADIALSVTGNAGPGTDPLNPNVGEIYIAVAGPGFCQVNRLDLKGDRHANRLRACKESLRLLLHGLAEKI